MQIVNKVMTKTKINLSSWNSAAAYLQRALPLYLFLHSMEEYSLESSFMD